MNNRAFDTAETEEVCPECGGEVVTQKWLAHECSAGCDTSVKSCLECDWKGDPE